MRLSENLHNLKLHDSDKYMALHFAPPDKKEELAALFNFHYLVSQIPVEVSEPMIGMIKFQWWRDCLEEIIDGKPPRPHPVLLGLHNSNVNLQKLQVVIGQYENLLENQLPTDFAQLDDFINNTQDIIFQQAANILETTHKENPAKAYCYNFLARKLNVASPAIAQNLLLKSKELAGRQNTVFDVITAYYNGNLKGPRWRLLLKLAFSRAVFL